MKNEDKIVELLAESLKRLDRMVDGQAHTNQRLDQTNQRLDQTNQRLDQTNHRLDQAIQRLDRMDEKLGRLETRVDRHGTAIGRIEDQLVKLNLQTVENTRALYKLAEKADTIAGLHDRVVKLEKAVFK